MVDEIYGRLWYKFAHPQPCPSSYSSSNNDVRAGQQEPMLGERSSLVYLPIVARVTCKMRCLNGIAVVADYHRLYRLT